VEVLWIVIPGTVVGVLVFDSVRRIFSDDDRLVRKLIADQPITMLVAATIVGSALVWSVLRVLRVW